MPDPDELMVVLPDQAYETTVLLGLILRLTASPTHTLIEDATILTTGESIQLILRIRALAASAMKRLPEPSKLTPNGLSN